jgi:anti-sigma factor RsiW
MTTRKQRRRRAKEHRHEYVWEDDEGNELDPDEVPAHRTDGRAPQRRAAATGRRAQPPSWPRTFKRALIFAPIMLATVMLLSSNLTLGAQVVQAAFIVGIFIPFSYFLDGVFWRSYQKRAAREQAGRGRSG